MESTQLPLVDPFNPVTPAFLQNPYPYYRALREKEPVFWSAESNYWLLTRYSDVRHCLTNASFAKRPPTQNSGCPFTRLKSTRAYSFVKEWIRRDSKRPTESKWLSHQDPPEHTRLRSLLNPPFSVRAIAELNDDIERIADSLLDRVAHQDQMDIIADYAFPLSITVIARLLGVPTRDQMRFRSWSTAIVSGFAATATKAQRGASRRAMSEFSNYLRPLLDERKGTQSTDLLGVLLAARHEDGLTEAELLSNCIMLIVFGHETTTHLIGNGVCALLQNPDQLSYLRRQPNLIDSAIEEFLRFDSPVQLTVRFASEDTTLGGKLIKAGVQVILVTGAANRDPEIFYDPDRLDITRKPNRHLDFGLGIHSCLGATLARLEGRIAINRLLQRLSGLTLPATRLEFNLPPIIRGLRALPVHF